MDSDRAASLIDEIVERQRARDRADAELSALMVEFVDLRTEADREAQSGRPQAQRRVRPGEFAADEVAMAMAQSTKRVQNTLAMTRRVRRFMPSLWATWCAGDLDAYKVSKIDQAMRRLCYDASVRSLDRRVVEVAGDKTPKQLKTWLNRFVAHAEPDRLEVRHRRAFADRAVHCFQELDGMGWISGAGTAMDAAAIDAALSAQARALGADDPRSMDQRRADLYVAALKQLIGHPNSGDTAASPVSIGVLVPIQSLLGYDNTPGDLLDRSNTVPAGVVRDLAQEVGTVFYRLLTDEAGRLMDVTQMGKHPSSLLRYALVARSGTCRWPTGSTPAAECDLDHHQPWPRGSTEASNLGPLARRPHRGKTHAGFTARRINDATQWTTPTGHTYTVGDDPLPVGSWLTDPEPPIDWPPQFYVPDDWITPADLVTS